MGKTSSDLLGRTSVATNWNFCISLLGCSVEFSSINSISSSLEDQRNSLVRNDLIAKALVVFKAGAGDIYNLQ